jgi:hypothetical protein
MISIPWDLQKPHDETNEDGKVTHHPGYEVRKCSTCGAECMASKDAMAPTCGMHDGNHLKKV